MRTTPNPFLDDVTIEVESGSGGRGATSFRREKYVPNGGPDGGDGGRGGDVVIRVSRHIGTLAHLRDRKRHVAKKGEQGAGQRKTGASADHLVIDVPAGTVVMDADSGDVIADLVELDAETVAVRGGRGGRGNCHFSSSVRQSPRVSELGEPGTVLRVRLEVRVIADIGLVGAPNAGKSTLLAALTSAHPKIANYPFTTLSPNLGVMELPGHRTAVIADVPGLIEGAHSGSGLGIDFLRHLERTRILVHVVDSSEGAEEARHTMEVIAHEIFLHSETLASKVALVAFNKMDMTDVAAQLANETGGVAISAAGLLGLEALRERVNEALEAAPLPTPLVPVVSFGNDVHADPADFSVVAEDDGWRVVGGGIERLVAMTDQDSDESLVRLHHQLERLGVYVRLRRQGAAAGATIKIGESEFSFDE